jgi:hypothetical protein
MDNDGGMRHNAEPQYLRRSHPLNQVLPATVRWVGGLPPAIRPLALLRGFPRIANQLARVWQDARSVAKSMDALLLDRRGGRRGFPVEVQSDLLVLRDFVEGRYPASPDIAVGSLKAGIDRG